MPFEETAKNLIILFNPFPYAGITQIRFKGLISVIHIGITPLTASDIKY
jgi:hypothetical protein